MARFDLSQQQRDEALLQKFGYRQELRRTLGFLSNFAVAFSYISVSTGTFSLFYLGLAAGGSDPGRGRQREHPSRSVGHGAPLDLGGNQARKRAGQHPIRPSPCCGFPPGAPPCPAMVDVSVGGRGSRGPLEAGGA